MSMPTKGDTAVRYTCELAGDRRVGLGCIGLTGIYGRVSKERAIDTLHAALDEGLTLFDTAALYASGANEELIGSVLGQRPEVAIVTKFGLYANSDGALVRDSSPRTIRASVEASLRRLRRERIDLLLQHRPDQSVSDDVVAETVAALVSEGKVASFGLSGTEVARVGSWSRNPNIVAVQNELSLANPLRSDEPEIMLSVGAVFMAFAPLGRGLVTKSSPGKDGDLRAGMPGFAETVSGACLRIIDVVSGLAARRETCNAAVALAWLLAKSPNIVAIPGCRSRAQVHEAASGSKLTLSGAELAELEGALINR
jgi:aryl-alcohol dehydrogenase-like predicted oxidoreductase